MSVINAGHTFPSDIYCLDFVFHLFNYTGIFGRHKTPDSIHFGTNSLFKIFYALVNVI